MQTLSLILAGLFLPLFPLGMIFNLLFQRIPSAWLRALLLVLWPLPGVWLITLHVVEIPEWLLLWALFSAALYGFRAVVVREFGVWVGFFATSAWTLGWIGLAVGETGTQLYWHVLAFSLPLALLILLTGEIERRYESAYAGVVSGVAQGQPRLSAMLVVTMLAVIGSPLFPAFFAMLNTIVHAAAALPLIALGLAGVWLLWSWSGAKLMQELLIGPAATEPHDDISHSVAAGYVISLLVLLAAGLYLSGAML